MLSNLASLIGRPSYSLVDAPPKLLTMKSSRPREERVTVNSFASECFRDVADTDYIAARMHYRLGLIEQFQWSALQAIEKYLKAILLYNGYKANGLSHNLMMALQRVGEIKEFSIELQDSERNLIRHVDKNGQNRYLEQSSFTSGEELLWLDSTVWSLRRYCQVLNYTITDTHNQRINMLKPNLEEIRLDFYIENPHRFRITGGFLEAVLDGKKGKQLREQLTWKNFKYGRRRKNSIKNFTFRSRSVIPPHIRDPNRFKVLDKYVDFPRRIRNSLAKL
jgi:hypothetical protein